jgi:hypothetical protein
MDIKDCPCLAVAVSPVVKVAPRGGANEIRAVFWLDLRAPLSPSVVIRRPPICQANIQNTNPNIKPLSTGTYRFLDHRHPVSHRTMFQVKRAAMSEARARINSQSTVEESLDGNA